MMVTAESARQFSTNEKWEMVDADHSQIAKINRGEGGIYPSVLFCIRSALILNAQILTQAEARSIEPWRQRSVNSNENILGFAKSEDERLWKSSQDPNSDTGVSHGIDVSCLQQVSPIVGGEPPLPTINRPLLAAEAPTPLGSQKEPSLSIPDTSNTLKAGPNTTESSTTLAATIDSTN